MHKYTVAAHTDVGVVKKINQDSLLIEIAETDIGQILLAAVCDGMGGLSQGEIASATMTRAIGEWFENSLAASICKSGSMRRKLSFYRISLWCWPYWESCWSL